MSLKKTFAEEHDRENHAINPTSEKMSKTKAMNRLRRLSSQMMRFDFGSTRRTTKDKNVLFHVRKMEHSMNTK